MNKIFCIGFQKTGTKSMALALSKLGYKVAGPNGTRDPNIKENVMEMALRIAENKNAFQDNPWPVIYKEMDEKFVNSKFILTLRDEKSWIQSVSRYFGKRESPMREWIYGNGSPIGNEKKYLEVYNDHIKDVLDYFSDRKNDLLIMNIFEGDGWEKLCPFLEKDIPNEKFPHKNKYNQRRFNLYRKIMSLRKKMNSKIFKN